jgi:hypothetical protein
VGVGEGVWVGVGVEDGVTVSSDTTGAGVSVAVEKSGVTGANAVGVAAGGRVVRPTQAVTNDTSSATLAKRIQVQILITCPSTVCYL